MNKIKSSLPIIAVVLSMLMLTSAQAGLPSTAVPEAKQGRDWWMSRHAEKVAQAKTGKADLVMIGDSITHNWEKQRNYADLFGPYHTLNLGFGGDRTQNVLWRLQNGEVDGISPKLVTLMIGTNNSRGDTPEAIYEGIRAIVAELRQRLPESKIVVLSVFPRNHSKTSGDFEQVKAINQLLPSIADDKRVFHLDINRYFLDESGQLRAELYGRDLLHLSNKGYNVWYEALKPLLNESGIKISRPAAEASVAVTKSPPVEPFREAKVRHADPFKDPFANPTDDPSLPRVLIIGDSISIGYTTGVRKLLAGKANVHRVKGNCRYSAFGVQHIDTWLGEGDWDVIHFNFGLWDWYGWSQDQKATPESYAANLDTIVTKLKATEAELIFAVTTPPCIGPERKVKFIVAEARAKAFNDAALTVMKKHGIVINDLYTPIAGKRVQYQLGPGNVHYGDEGKRLQAQQVSEVIEDTLAKLTADTEAASIIRLWPIERVGGEPNRLKEVYRDRRGRKQLCGVLDPNLTVHLAKSEQPTPAVVYCPGGAYKILAIPSVEEIKKWNDLGISLFVLKYTIPNDPDAAFQDIQRAMRLVRHQAQKWNVDPNRIGVFGNSAGGHLSARLTQNTTQKVYDPVDAADAVSCEPNFAILQCAAYFQGMKLDQTLDTELFPMSQEVAPTFLTYSKDDKFCAGGIAYARALTEAGGSIHLELFEKGGHGMQGCDWFSPAAKWLNDLGVVQ